MFLLRVGKFCLDETCIIFKIKADHNKKREDGIKGKRQTLKNQTQNSKT